ncbi:MAG: NADAR family protein [Myxococcales bacterium]|nr:NADAR family protein [Myxococcales bacterium]
MHTLNLETLRQAVRQGAQPRYRLFYGHTPRPDGALSDAVFSQFWPCSFSLYGVNYAWAEQWMMASKARLFGDGEALARILIATAPLDCKRIGRQVRGFDEALWRQHRFDIVTQGSVAKFDQDPALRAYLLATSADVLVEASPSDCVWGIRLGREHADAQNPLRWRGQNLLGFALMRARGILRGELPKPELPALLTS